MSGAERQRRWSKAHKAEIQSYRRANRAKSRECVRRYGQAHKDKRAELSSLRRARKAGAFIERVYRSVVFKRDRGMCGECHMPVAFQQWELDHIIPLSKGGAHSYNNVQVTHPICNRRKGVRIADSY